MKAEQIKVLEELLASSDFKGKDILKHLLWLNTAPSKYKIGECFLVTDRSRRIYGVPVVNFKAKVIRIFSWKNEEEYYYELEMECVVDDKTYTTKLTKPESELRVLCEDNQNLLGEANSKYCDECSM